MSITKRVEDFIERLVTAYESYVQAVIATKKDFGYDIPSVEDCQAMILKSRRNAVANRLAEGTHGTIYTHQLTPESVNQLIQECVAKGYTVAKHGPTCFKEDELYVYLGSSPGNYIKTYGGEVIAAPKESPKE